MTRILQIIGHSGAGKSIISFNLGVALSQMGRDVIAIDGNLHSPDLSSYSAASPSSFLNDYLAEDVPLSSLIGHHSSGLRLIASLKENDSDREVRSERAQDSRIHLLLLSLLGRCDIVLLDALSRYAHSADECILVTNDDYHAVVKSKEIIEAHEKKGASVIGAIINRRTKADREKIETILRKRILCEIPHDPLLVDSINKRQPATILYPRCAFSKTVRDLASLIEHE